MSGAQPDRWRFRIVAFVPLFAILPTLVRDRGMVAAMWPVWRGMIEQLVLVVAGGIAVAAVVFGVVTWRRARRTHA